MTFEIVGGADSRGDDVTNWFGEEDMQAADLRCVDSSSGSEGLLFGGYNGDSGDCTSSEESNMEWSAEKEPQPVGGDPVELQPTDHPHAPSADLLGQNSAARRFRRILPVATAAEKPQRVTPKGGQAGPGRGRKGNHPVAHPKRKDKRNRAQVRRERNREKGRPKACSQQSGAFGGAGRAAFDIC